MVSASDRSAARDNLINEGISAVSAGIIGSAGWISISVSRFSGFSVWISNSTG